MTMAEMQRHVYGSVCVLKSVYCSGSVCVSSLCSIVCERCVPLNFGVHLYVCSVVTVYVVSCAEKTCFKKETYCYLCCVRV
jgi:hypothetical protein